MFVLDTDIVSLWEEPTGSATQRLRSRLNEVPEEDVATTIVTYEEQTRGWFAVLAKAKSATAQISACALLHRHLDNYLDLKVLDFNERAAVEYQRLKSLRLKVGSMDLKIGAIVLANSATLITRNLRDFRQIPTLRIEDWTR